MKRVLVHIVLVGLFTTALLYLQSCKKCCRDASNPDCENYKGPITFDVALKLSGTIEEDNDILNIEFYNPGSPIPTATGNYLKPIYNNILGVFNVLELPELEFAELNPSIRNFTQEQMIQAGILSSNTCQRNHDENDDNYDGAGSIKLRQYTPKTNIKYVVNPAAGVEVESVEAAIVLEYNKDQGLFLQRPDNIGGTAAIPYHGLMTMTQDVMDNSFCWQEPDTE